MNSATARLLVCGFFLFLVPHAALSADRDAKPWSRHTIDNSSVGADGVRLADVNGDGLPDIVTGWEEGGVVRLYLNPGPARAASRWPAVTVGTVASVEDAVLVDLDGDGALDVVSSCEGKTKAMFIHWAPKDKTRLLAKEVWQTEALPAAQNRMQWMFCLPMQIDGRHGVDLFAGGKNRGGELGWFEAPEHPRQLEAWRWHALREAGWIMSLETADMDGDADLDLVFSDRKGKRSGCFWLENPGRSADLTQPWQEHVIGLTGREVMFLTLVDLDRDDLQDVIAAVKPRELIFLRRRSRDGLSWEPHAIPLPLKAGSAKAVNAGDIDLDGKLDLVFTCEGATNKSGVMWLSYPRSATDPEWEAHDICGLDGVKHDLVQLLDLDDDGDLDVLTCEETKNLGVVWYENPARSRK